MILSSYPLILPAVRPVKLPGASVCPYLPQSSRGRMRGTGFAAEEAEPQKTPYFTPFLWMHRYRLTHQQCLTAQD